ncbi:nucleotidyltransferase domain-containing protein [Pseudothermotoga thermarum]|uniref:DNA polymerase beta domain protein region n=1 Tax=Pseudothermotoga thermarum DSM 5069 TaxID=688269 RepID=F7YXB0_9THEM|nr:nucleotidyltransferase domain-containing protein [Pseudothermotoga thermarum]AEH51468.1 DNA polymerase beta domain protein region [Pseudothermotoga thermarum DSM 5069]
MDREKILETLKKVSEEAYKTFPQIKKIILFGSLARGDHTGLSDVDLILVATNLPKNPIERLKLFYPFFSDRIPIALDLIVIEENEMENIKHMLGGPTIIL